jgi:hypothetical protein
MARAGPADGGSMKRVTMHNLVQWRGELEEMTEEYRTCHAAMLAAVYARILCEFEIMQFRRHTAAYSPTSDAALTDEIDLQGEAQRRAYECRGRVGGQECRC